MFVKYDYENNQVNLTGDGEWLLVLNEVKLYEGNWRESYKDFAMQASKAASGEIVPRLLKTNVGDIYTTNCLVSGNTSGSAEVDMGEVAVGDIFSPSATGYLAKAEGDIQFKVVKVYTMPDGQEGVKLQRIK